MAGLTKQHFESIAKIINKKIRLNENNLLVKDKFRYRNK